MRHRAVKIVHLALLVASTMLAFLVLEELDEQAALDYTADIWIKDTDGSASAVQAGSMVRNFAHDHDISVVRQESDIREPDRVSHLFIAAGDPDSAPASWLERGYSSFSGGMRFHTHTLDQISDPDPRGAYHVYGSEDAVKALQAEFAELGLTGDVVPPFDPRQHIQSQAAELGLVFGVVALGVVLIVGASVLLSAKEYAVLRLHGMSLPSMLRRDLRRLAPFWLIAVAVVAAITLVVLGLYNGFARVGLFSLVAVGLAGTLSLLAILAHAGALVLATRSSIVRGLQGAVATRPAMASTYLVRVAAALLVLLLGGMTVGSWQQVQQQEAHHEEVASLGEDATYVAFRGSRTPETSEAMSDQVGRWLRSADDRGQVIVSYHRLLAEIAPPGAGLPAGHVLRVNETFLAEQQILDPEGNRYVPEPGDDRVRILVPEKLHEHADTITERVPSMINPADQGARVHEAGVEHMWARDGQAVATFQSDEMTALIDRLMLDDPVLVVVPNGSPVTSPIDYTAMATRDGVIFRDRQDALDAIGREVPREHITELAPVAGRAAAEHAEAAHELRLGALTLMAGVLVLFVTGLGVCVIYGRKNAQTIFAKHISGWTFLAIHRKLFLLDTLVACALLSWVGWNIWSRTTALERFTERGVPPPPTLPQPNWWELAPAAGVAALAMTMLVVAVGLAHRRIVKAHAADV
ncbi:hypothetical protein [Haloechinothrix sp. LS1_15]|uniref:hypothetical protein n=1 Tax=Haloechinothrix sp. LS1_15 TaxID=2652248 RepID=UPI0029452E61|nr:hypothetical protein [Haloechinothrix sp. LS1_15]MDV6013000.1 hypothetical protein [Haloechinothrix sp. LS1_15]